MSRSSHKATTAAIVAHGDSEIARLRERVSTLSAGLAFALEQTLAVDTRICDENCKDALRALRSIRIKSRMALTS